MSSKPNDNGRALEYCFVEQFIQHFPNVVLANKTTYYQNRDKIKFDLLPIIL